MDEMLGLSGAKVWSTANKHPRFSLNIGLLLAGSEDASRSGLTLPGLMGSVQDTRDGWSLPIWGEDHSEWEQVIVQGSCWSEWVRR